MRFRSNSNLTADSIEAEGSIEHPVESRTRTAELPPVMVSFEALVNMNSADTMGSSQKSLMMIPSVGLDLKKTV